MDLEGERLSPVVEAVDQREAPQRLVRGQSHGLGLFLAQTVVHGHRGQATARRHRDGTLQLDFLLPAMATAPSA